jgi:hypothetical protein
VASLLMLRAITAARNFTTAAIYLDARTLGAASKPEW